MKSVELIKRSGEMKVTRKVALRNVKLEERLKENPEVGLKNN